jgi:hypothetical protein
MMETVRPEQQAAYEIVKVAVNMAVESMRQLGIDDSTLSRALLVRGLAIAIGIDDAAAEQMLCHILAESERRAQATAKIMPPGGTA